MKTESNLLYIQVKEKLIDDIKQMQPHDRLLSRTGLAKKYQVARTTIDRAISELIGEGYLYSRDGSGTYVAGNETPAIETGKTEKVVSWGVIVHDVTEVFHSKIVRGVENVAQSHGINLILCNSDSDLNKQGQYIQRLSRSGVAGIIIVPIVSSNPRECYRLFSQLTELKVPYVFCNRSAEGLNAPIVASNDFYGGYIATKHLLEMGYRNIAYISHRKNRVSVDRCQGYISALMENGIEVNQKIIGISDEQIIVISDERQEEFGYEATNKLLAAGQIVDAIFCVSDKLAQGVYQAITEAGLAVSDDIGVIGYNNAELSEKFTPPLTSVDFKNLEVGIKAAEVLLKRINKEDLLDFHLYLIHPQLVVRESCLGLKKMCK
jgi:DNA-binding LacI/PurR family transcriptional regulator